MYDKPQFKHRLLIYVLVAIAAIFGLLLVLACATPTDTLTSTERQALILSLEKSDDVYDDIRIPAQRICRPDNRLIAAQACDALNTAGREADKAWSEAANSLVDGSSKAVVESKFATLAIKLGVLKATWEAAKPEEVPQ